jgi:hypothetical protein
MFDAINGQRPGQKLDFVAEDFAGGRAGQEDGIGKNASAERQIEGRGASVLEGDGLGPVGLDWPAAEYEVDVREPERGLIDHDDGHSRNPGERQLPGTILATAMLNPMEYDRITDQADQEDGDDLFPEGEGTRFGHGQSYMGW